MKFDLERVSDPEIEPVTLAEAKRNLHEYVSVTTRDDDVTNLIVAAREWVEDFTGRALIDQTWRLTLDSWRGGVNVNGDTVSGYNPLVPPFAGRVREDWLLWLRTGEILLRKAPVIAITSIVTLDTAGVATTIDATTYELRVSNSRWPKVIPLNGALWPSGTLQVLFRAGFANRDVSPAQDASAVPERFKQAMKLWIQANYDPDEKMTPLLLDTAERLIKSERSDISLA